MFDVPFLSIEETTWCSHGKRNDDYCEECELEWEDCKLANNWAGKDTAVEE